MEDKITNGEVMARIVGEALKVKATVVRVARRYGLNANQVAGAAPYTGWLIGWRRI